MNGKVIVSFLIGVSAIAGAGLWYTTNFLYYESVTAETVILQGDQWPVDDYQGIDAESSPLKLRACFKVDWDFIPDETHKEVSEPLRAPYWFDCFNAETIAKDIAADAATVHLASKNEPFGFTTYVAQYPDGRAYMWRQINDCGEAQAEGDPLPQGCEDVRVADTTPLTKTLGGPNPGQPLDMTMTLVPVGGGNAEAVIADELQVVSSNAQPELIWACFKVLMNHSTLTESYQLVDAAAPLKPLVDIDCFDAETLAADLQTGDALAFLGQRDVAPGIDRMVAIYDDGRAFAWHQRMD
ncbi:MAG: DUF6446 family protein [Pseudomonadota bacterium]